MFTVLTRRDDMTTKERIIEVAREEFINNGYDKASLRTIAKKCDITATALYRHFKDKEDIFMSVALKFVNKLKEIADYITSVDYDLLLNNNPSEVWGFEGSNDFHFELIFKMDKDLVKLLINERRDWLKDLLITNEYEESLKYLEKMEEFGYKVNDFNKKAFRAILNSYVEAYFEVLNMNLDENESYDICKEITRFYTVGFRNLLGF